MKVIVIEKLGNIILLQKDDDLYVVGEVTESVIRNLSEKMSDGDEPTKVVVVHSQVISIDWNINGEVVYRTYDAEEISPERRQWVLDLAEENITHQLEADEESEESDECECDSEDDENDSEDTNKESNTGQNIVDDIIDIIKNPDTDSNESEASGMYDKFVFIHPNYCVLIRDDVIIMAILFNLQVSELFIIETNKLDHIQSIILYDDESEFQVASRTRLSIQNNKSSTTIDGFFPIDHSDKWKQIEHDVRIALSEYILS